MRATTSGRPVWAFLRCEPVRYCRVWQLSREATTMPVVDCCKCGLVVGGTGGIITL